MPGTARPAFVLALVLLGCSESQEPSGIAARPELADPHSIEAVVRTVELGRAIGAGQRVEAAGEELRAGGPLAVALQLEGNSTAVAVVVRLRADGGAMLAQASRTLDVATPTRVAFELAPAGGVPAGRHSLEIALNGRTVETRSVLVTSVAK